MLAALPALAQLNFVGGAQPIGGIIRLTRARNGLAGAVWRYPR